MAVSLKYAVIERERRFLVASIPGGVSTTSGIVDRYLTGTRLRLREVTDEDGAMVLKLGHKVRLAGGPREIACTSMYLDNDEWELLSQLPARTLRKTRYVVARDGLRVAIDQLEDGTLLAEIDDGESPVAVPDWLEVVADVSGDEAWTGSRLAR